MQMHVHFWIRYTTESWKITEEKNKMQLGSKLYVYKGEWGLPSIDFECMRALVSLVAS